MDKIDLRENEYLEKFVGQDHVSCNDTQFWYQLLSRSFNFMRVNDPRMVDKTLEPYIVRLTLNNSKSLNIGSLVHVFLDRISKIKPSTPQDQQTNIYHLFQSFNALYLIRTICKSYIETLSEEQLIKAFHLKEPASQEWTEDVPGASMFDRFISTLVAIIVDIPLDDSSYLLKVESMNSLLVLLSSQMYSNIPANQIIIYKSLMYRKCSIHALVLTKTLLTYFIEQRPAPQESGSLIIGLASGIWRVLTLGYSNSEEEFVEDMPQLARKSLLLLNILTNHCTTNIKTKNPYREAITSCQDSRFNLTDPVQSFVNANNDVLATASTSKSALVANSIKIDFQKLLDTICLYLDNDQVALLLYMLLQSNNIFRPFLLTTASDRLDRLLLPLLKILYSSFERGSHHVYMVLIIFVILSEEVLFNQAIQKIILRNIPWYKDRIFSEISLGSFTALILIRSFQYNTFRLKDKFLHTNLFATLANLSNHFHQLHPYVCQRLIEFLERLGKRYMIITKTSDNNFRLNGIPESDPLSLPLAKALATNTTSEHDIQDASSIELNSSSFQNDSTEKVTSQQNGDALKISIPASQQQFTPTDHRSDMVDGNVHLASIPSHDQQLSPEGSISSNDQIKISMDETNQDVSTICDVIRMLLEIINNVLVVRLKENPDMVYTLLYKRNVFTSLLSSHPTFYNLVINVERVLAYAYNQIDALGRPLSTTEIKDLIKDICNNWKFEQEKGQESRLLFHYVEDEQPEEFFIPYIWTRVYYSSQIFWDSKRIALFNPDDV